jgi:hypothetical protein
MLRGLFVVKQPTVLDGLAFDPFSFQQDGLTAPPRYRNQDSGRPNTTLWGILALVAAAIVVLVVAYSYNGYNANVAKNSAAPTSDMNAPARTVPANPSPSPAPAPAPAPPQRTQ